MPMIQTRRILSAAAIILVVFASLVALARPAAQQSQWNWQPAATYGGAPTWFAAAFSLAGKGFVATGYDFTNALWQYDPASETWTRRADFPGTPRGAAFAFAVGGKGYVGGGFREDARFADVWEYDPAANAWRARASLPGRPRDHATAFTIGPRAYVAGGMTCDSNGCTDLAELWEYDPASDGWKRKADLPQPASAAASFVVAGKAYVVMGRIGATLLDSVLEYDPVLDRWTRKAPFPGPARARAVGFAVDGKGYVTTGMQTITQAAATVLRDMWEYEAARDTWTRLPDVPAPARGAAISFVIGSRVYIGTGVDAGRSLLKDFWWTEIAGGAGRHEDTIGPFTAPRFDRTSGSRSGSGPRARWRG